MTLHRRAAKRDGNEEAIRRALHERGWHSEPVSATGFPDLITWAPLRRDALLVEVKMPGEGPNKEQEEKWQELLERGIRVYVLATLADVAAFCLGRHEPWIPSPDAAPTKVTRAHERKAKVHKPGVSKVVEFDQLCQTEHCLISRATGSKFCLKHGPPLKASGLCPKCRHLLSAHDKRRGCTRAHSRGIGACGCTGPAAYVPPQTKRPDASALAAATFAPPACPYPTCSGDCEHGR